MKAMVITQLGGTDVFEQQDRPIPQVLPGHLLIKVAATSLNPLDTLLRSSQTPWSENLPEILHGDVAGVIEAVGEGVNNFKVGDEVYGCAGGIAGINGALAEYMLVDAQLMALKPKTLSMADAATLPLVAITAWEALHDKLKIQAQEQVLIHGATGGVGHIAIQLAKYFGAKVSATCTARTYELAQTLGADHIINIENQSVDEYVQSLTHGQGFDAVFDTIAGDNIQLSFQAARLNGRVATTLPVDDTAAVVLKSLSFHGILMLLPLTQGLNRQAHGDILHHVAQLVDKSKLKPLIDAQRFSIWEVAKAHDYFHSGQAIGKISLSMTP